MKHSVEFWDRYLEENYDDLKKMVFRSFSGNAQTAEEAFSYVLEKLLEDKRKKLAAYEGKNGASEKTWLFFICRRLISDFVRSRKGRCKIPQWLLNVGNMLMIRTYDFLCCQKMSADDASEYLRDRVPGGRNPEMIQESIAMIAEKYPKCTEDHDREEELEEGNIASESRKNPHEDMEHKELSSIYRFILDIAGEEDKDNWDWTGVADLKKKIGEKFLCSEKNAEEQRLFLRMIHYDGMNAAEAGRYFGWDRFHARDVHTALLEKLRKIIGKDDLQHLLEMGDPKKRQRKNDKLVKNNTNKEIAP